MTVSARQMSVILAAIISAAILLVSQGGAWGRPQSSPFDKTDGKTYVAGELIVSFKPGTSGSTEDAAVRRSDARVSERLKGLNAEVLTFPGIKNDLPGKAREAALKQVKQSLQGAPGVASVDYDYVRHFFFTPNDPKFGSQWGFHRPAFPQAWNSTRGNGVRVADVDSGIAQNHPDLSSKIVAQRDFVNGDGVAEDDVDHGTHTAGTMAAVTNNGVGVAGGCPNCRLLVAKVGDSYSLTDRNIAEGIRWSADHHAQVINLSLGGPGNSNVLKNAVNYAYGKGAVLVAAAGNDGDSTISYPAAYSNVIAVAATTRTDRHARFSNHGSWVDVAAPGVDILSTVPGGYDSYSGTSMATPHVSALAGLLAAQGRSKTEIRSRITSTARDLGPAGRDPYFGAGRIDAARAVR